MLRITCLSAFLVSAILVNVFAAQDTAKDKGKDKDKKQATSPETPLKQGTHKVEKGAFKVEVSLKGIVESMTMMEVLISPEVFTPENRGQFRVVKAVEHGSVVRKGDQLLWLDMERIDQIIGDLERDRDLADLGFKLAEEDLRTLEKATPVDLAAAERAKKLANEDLKRYLTEDKEFLTKMIHYEVKMANDWLTYAKEELRQLEKMYKASDLTEATEEIILKRQRDMVERAMFYVKMAERDRDYMFKVGLPRKEDGLKENDLKLTLTLERTKIGLPLLLNQKRLSLDKMKFERERTAEKLQKFKKDRDAMLVKAPMEGVVYYGKCVRGNWSTASMESRLQRGGNLMPEEVLVTVVNPRPLFVRATIDEKDFSQVQPGLAARVVPTSLPEQKLPGKVFKVPPVPVAPGSFEAHVRLDDAGKQTTLMPGMACTVKLVPYQKTDALTVPTSAIFTDDNDEDVHYVFVQGKDDKHGKAYVTLGKKSGTRTEILQGVGAGDLVLLEKPAPAAPKAKAK